MNKNIPEMRFKGFSEEWEQRKLGEMSESFEYGLNVSAKSYDGRNKYLRITDIDESSRNFVTDKLTSPNTDLSTSDNYLLKKGDLLFARTGASVGKSYHYNRDDGKVYYAGFLIRARIKINYNSSFIFQNTLTDKYMNYIKVTSQRSGQPGVNAKEYSDYSLMVPKNVEQSKIGSFFKLLDNTIALHQRELDLLKQSKKGFLQKTFPKKEENVPVIRFPEFINKWKYVKIKELGNISTGSTPATSIKENYSIDGMLWVTPTDIKDKIIKDTAKKLSDIGQMKARIVPPNSILVTSIASIGKNALVESYASFNQQINAVTPNDDNNSYFLLTQSDFWSKKMNLLASTGTMKIVNKTDFSNLLVQVPSLKEQQKIGNFFKHLDDKISLHEEKLETLKQTKKALLQKMFI